MDSALGMSYGLSLFTPPQTPDSDLVEPPSSASNASSAFNFNASAAMWDTSLTSGSNTGRPQGAPQRAAQPPPPAPAHTAPTHGTPSSLSMFRFLLFFLFESPYISFSVFVLVSVFLCEMKGWSAMSCTFA